MFSSPRVAWFLATCVAPIPLLLSQASAFRTDVSSASTRRSQELPLEDVTNPATHAVGAIPSGPGSADAPLMIPFLPGAHEGHAEAGRLGHSGGHINEWDESINGVKDNPSAQEILLALGGGTGAGTGSGSVEIDRDLIRRMRYQDKLVLGLMIVAYFVALLFTASLSYRQATNNSPVKFYGDPRVEDLMIDNSDVEDFLHVFAQPPRSVQLCVQGLLPVPALLAHLAEGSLEWQGCFYRHVFSFGLDLSPFIVREGQTDAVAAEEVETLRKFLAEDTNDLATVRLMKEVSWEGWEELATNIKHKIRQKGFDGLIHVSWKNTETLTVYKNRTWANFLHRGITRVLLGLSLIGYAWYVPYMYLRQRGPEVQPKFRVDIDIQSYWQLIGEKINERGFDAQ